MGVLQSAQTCASVGWTTRAPLVASALAAQASAVSPLNKPRRKPPQLEFLAHVANTPVPDFLGDLILLVAFPPRYRYQGNLSKRIVSTRTWLTLHELWRGFLTLAERPAPRLLSLSPG